ncbi:methyltransferase [Hydrogenophaga sp.]|uniref:class I SAM-dependent methyltransferase n=1 Tax=Hydrogenophaga sp. TaxID=1904254 RepID=UPI00356ADB52
MPGYQVKHETISIGGSAFHIRSLLDTQQYADALGAAEHIGMSAASWPLFGQVWPSARVLALAMMTHNIVDKRILEIGAGLALASLVLHRRSGCITVTDWHPLTESFLQENLRLNGLAPPPYQAGNWEEEDASDTQALGLFDLIIGSDVLYERQQPAQLAHFVHRHAAPGAEILIVDPDRGNRAAFCRAMNALGYGLHTLVANKSLETGEAYKGRFLSFASTPLPS